MSSTTLYIVRHGQTFFNQEPERLGGDSELTPEGIATAKRNADVLGDVRFNAIYFSPYKRTDHVARIIGARHPGTPMIVEPRLKELSAGDMDSMEYEEFEWVHSDLFDARARDKYNFRFPNGESYGDGAARVSPLIRELNWKSGNYCLVGHRGTNRCCLGVAVGLPKQEVPHIDMPNGVIFRVNLEQPRDLVKIVFGTA